jgi:hypothetical protein
MTVQQRRERQQRQQQDLSPRPPHGSGQVEHPLPELARLSLSHPLYHIP